MVQPPRWSAEDLTGNIATATEFFRKERLEEPLEDYLEAFDEFQGVIEELFETTVDLTQLDTLAGGILTESKLLRAFRYLAGPPISEDDLKTVADVRSLSLSRLRTDQEGWQRIRDIVRLGIDRRRFPWIGEEREPSESEKAAAIIASAAVMAVSHVGTKRRSKSNTFQEEQVCGALIGSGLIQVDRREIQNTVTAPEPGHFCRESLVGKEKADFIVRLWDHRMMLIECKVSNSAVNSFKRVNHEAVGKAEKWQRDFGATQVVPLAILSGVFSLQNLQTAQDRGLSLFWAHNLKALTDWIETTRA